ncbi:hypothetical protein G9A89_007588 [Geosiphon pyriformis]|nr:hypothetical protein G9A89_007588 [Geosiphon pyriformis]
MTTPIFPRLVRPGTETEAEKTSETFSPDLNVRLICPDCRNPVPNIIEEFASGDLVCGDCGLVLGDRIIDTRSEWRTFTKGDNNDDDPSRVGDAANPLLEGSQLNTYISQRDGGTSRAKALNRVHYRAVSDKATITLTHAYTQIESMTNALELTKEVSDIAKQLYKRAQDETLLRPKNREAIMAACIYVACRVKQVGRTFKELCVGLGVPKKETGRCFIILKENLDIGLTPMSSEDLVARYCGRLGMRAEIRKAAYELTKRVQELGFMAARNQNTVAAGCIYVVAQIYQDPRTASEISRACALSGGAVVSSYQQLYKEQKSWLDVLDQSLVRKYFKLPENALEKSPKSKSPISPKDKEDNLSN